MIIIIYLILIVHNLSQQFLESAICYDIYATRVAFRRNFEQLWRSLLEAINYIIGIIGELYGFWAIFRYVFICI